MYFLSSEEFKMKSKIPLVWKLYSSGLTNVRSCNKLLGIFYTDTDTHTYNTYVFIKIRFLELSYWPSG